MNSKIYNTSLNIIKKLQDNGFSAFIVGGTVRDILLKNSDKSINTSTDVDIATSASPEQINALFKKTFNIGAAFGIVNVVENGISFEVATFREETGYTDGRHPNSVKYTDNPKKDAKRRDFTINALFFDPFKNEILDFVDGQSDLKKGILRTIGPPEKRFSEDYLRMLRAIRFGVRFGFVIDKAIIRAIKKLAPKLNKLSKERVRDELNRIFTGPRPQKALRLLSETGILSIVLPEIEAMKGVSQPKLYHPEGDVFEHTALMLDSMVLPQTSLIQSEIVSPTPLPTQTISKQRIRQLNTFGIELTWSVLLHDVGKPLTFKLDENNIERFILHADKGALIAEKILTRLKFPKAFIADICFAVKNHMRFATAKKMRTAKLKRLIAEPTFPLELELHRIDCFCSNKLTDNFTFLLDTIFEQKGETKLPPPLITGKDLIELGFSPGPEFGKILKTIEEKQIGKELYSKEDAIKWIKNILH
jgi:poly(A) polymerase